MKNQNRKKKSEDSSGGVHVGGDVSGSIFVKGDGNTIKIDGAKRASASSKRKPTSKKSSKYRATLIVAWIGFWATILAALITVFGNRLFSEPTPSAPFQTEVLILDTPSSTLPPAPDDSPPSMTPTLTPIILFTETPLPAPEATPIPPVALGNDWIAGCISTLWKVYPSTVETIDQGNGCWVEPVHVFSTANGKLDFFAERSRGKTAEIYGLFAPLPPRGTVTFTVRLRNLDNADLWMGVFNASEFTSEGLLLTIPSGDIRALPVVQKNPFTYYTIQGTIPLDQRNGLSISFEFDTLSVRSKVNPGVFATNPVSMPYPQKWLFLGYRGLSGTYRIKGEFTNFELKP